MRGPVTGSGAGLRWVAALVLAGVSLAAQAISYVAPMDKAEWRLELSPFACRMWQPIPVYGDAVFEALAGEQQRFYLDPVRNPMREGKASLITTAPAWDPQRPTTDMGYVPVRGPGERPVELDSRGANQLLDQLYQGMGLVFTRRAWYSATERIQVGMSPVNFRRAYAQYRGCLADLLPISFDEVARTRVHFQTAKWTLTPAAREKLDLVVRFAKADPSISGFFVDGHTDSVGRKLYNLELSQKRAETVTKYLIANGVDGARITTRYHGERYPVAPNNSVDNRASNRRVTIRLERDGIAYAD